MEDTQSHTESAGVASVAKDQQDSPKMGFFDAVINPPDWLNQAYVEEALRKYEGDASLKITSYSVKTCTKPGDNFIGVIFRAGITYTTRAVSKTDSFIFKVEAFMAGAKMDMVANRPYFATEGRMYLEVLPLMQDLLKNIGDTEILAPGLVHYGADPKILIFKDIAPEGFEMSRMPVPFAQATMIGKKLGKFHALSYFLKEELHFDKVETFQEGMFTEKDIADWEYMDGYLNVLCELLKEWDCGLETVANKLAVLKPHFIGKMLQLYKGQNKDQGFNVLNHGDFHIRNLLFRFNGEDKTTTFEDIRIIDFQCSVYATPAIDLGFLLYVIGDDACREEHRDELLKEYHGEFKTTLVNLGYLGAIPTLLDVQKEILRNGLMELFAATVFMTMFHMDVENSDDFGDMEAIPKMARATYEIPVMKRALQRILPELMYKGLLDV